MARHIHFTPLKTGQRNICAERIDNRKHRHAITDIAQFDRTHIYYQRLLSGSVGFRLLDGIFHHQIYICSVKHGLVQRNPRK